MDSATSSNARGKIFSISSPSGGGKSTLIHGLLRNDPTRFVPVSITTRPPRRGEVEGKDYHFVTPEEFNRAEKAGEYFAAHEVYGNRYAGRRSQIEEALAAGRDIFVDTNAEGMELLRKAFPGEVVSVFMTPHPRIDCALQILREHIEQRGDTPPDVVESRMAKARQVLEEPKSHHFDHILYCYDFDKRQNLTSEQILTKVETFIAKQHALKPVNLVVEREYAALRSLENSWTL